METVDRVAETGMQRSNCPPLPPASAALPVKPFIALQSWAVLGVPLSDESQIARRYPPCFCT